MNIEQMKNEMLKPEFIKMLMDTFVEKFEKQPTAEELFVFACTFAATTR